MRFMLTVMERKWPCPYVSMMYCSRSIDVPMNSWKNYIIHLFQDLIGLSPHQYITKQRLNRCADAIRSGTSISEAYLSCGFHDYSGFYRAFVKEYGESPRSYQKSHLPKEYPSQRKDAES